MTTVKKVSQKKVCKNCQSIFYPVSNVQKYCSIDCKKNFYKNLIKHYCRNCGIEVISTKQGPKEYCSLFCREKFHDKTFINKQYARKIDFPYYGTVYPSDNEKLLRTKIWDEISERKIRKMNPDIYYDVEIIVYRQSRDKMFINNPGDLDNYIKNIIDSVKNKLIGDDSKVRKIVAELKDNEPLEGFYLKIKPYEDK